MKPTLPALAPVLFAATVLACDKSPTQADAPAASAPAAASLATTAPSAPERLRAPDIIIDQAGVAVGNDRVPAGELGLVDKIAVFVSGRPMIEGQTVNVVAMRNAKPAEVTATLAALRRAKAAGAVVKSDARDGTTQKLPVAFTSSVPDCATVAWIAKDASIEVWPAGGGAAHRVIKGLAGPDMTLGLEAMRKQWAGCAASQIVLGADDVLSWGLVFDLGTGALQAPGARADSAVLVSSTNPGHKVSLD
jgi:hypothetical protein